MTPVKTGRRDGRQAGARNKIRVAVCQTDPKVGDVPANLTRALEALAAAVKGGADLVVFGEMATVGYPPEDLLARDTLVSEAMSAAETVVAAGQQAGVAVIVGSPRRTGGRPGVDAKQRRVANSCLVGDRTGRRSWVDKTLLPNHGPFDEARWIRAGGAGAGPVTLTVGRTEIVVGVEICEDLWGEDVTATLTAGGAELIVVANASPYEVGKQQVRAELCARRAEQAGVPVIYVNLVGGADELVFDGGSLAAGPGTPALLAGQEWAEGVWFSDVDPDGRIEPAGVGACRALNRAGTGGWQVGDTILPAAREPAVRADSATGGTPAALGEEAGRVWAALEVGLADYLAKCGIDRVVLGLSGGIDSAVVATLAADALGPAAVTCLAMPAQHSSAASVDDARECARRLGVNFAVIPVSGIVEAAAEAAGGALGVDPEGVAAENLQARARGMTVMCVSNATGALTLACGNKSEMAVGYTTLYGDLSGGWAPLKDVPKTWVWELARWRNEHSRQAASHLGRSHLEGSDLEGSDSGPIPQAIVDKVPSAELAPGQADSDDLGDYSLLDQILARYVDGDADGDELVADGYDEELVAKIVGLVDRAEFKRRQAPIGPKITSKAFGRDRRLPVAARTGWEPGGRGDPDRAGPRNPTTSDV